MTKLKMAAVALLLSGCFSYGRKLDQDKVSQIKNGSTKRDVLRLIGSPDNTTSDGNGNSTFSYTFMRVTSHAANYIPIIGPLVGGHDVQNQMVIVSFSSSNIVSNVYASYGGTETGIGAGAASKADIKSDGTKRPQ